MLRYFLTCHRVVVPIVFHTYSSKDAELPSTCGRTSVPTRVIRLTTRVQIGSDPELNFLEVANQLRFFMSTTYFTVRFNENSQEWRCSSAGPRRRKLRAFSLFLT